MKKVSVIIPVYNVQKYLDECIMSVSNQTLEDIEIICVDDGSTDQSLDILTKYKKRDSRIIILENTKNKGQSFARNKGMEYARGEYLYFLDSDDYIKCAALENLYNIAKDESLDAILFDGEVIFESEKYKKQFKNYQSKRQGYYDNINSGEELFQKLIQNNEWSASPPRQFWRKEYLKKIDLKFLEGVIHEDELFSLKGILQAKKIQYIQEQFFVRRFRSGSTMTLKQNNYRIKSKLIIYKFMLLFWENNNFSLETNYAIREYVERFIKGIKSIDYNDAIEQERVLLGHLYNLIALNGVDEKKYRPFITELMEMKNSYKHLIIYGAGQIAKDVIMLFDKNNIFISKIVVSKQSKEKSYLYGHRIYEIDELKSKPEESLIVIATGKQYSQVIEANIKKRGYTNYIRIF